MKPQRGYYSLIQYCPDASRAESANVGVLLFCPDVAFIEARTAAGNDRIRRFFGDRPFDRRQVNAAKRAIEERLKVDAGSFRTVEDLQRFIDTRGNQIILTQPRPVKVFDPRQDLDQLFGELVGGRARREQGVGPVLPELDRVFRVPALANRIRFDQEVTIPIINRPMRVPYAYQNGVLNYVKPEVFSGDIGRGSRLAERLAIEGDLLAKNPVDGMRRKLIVVASVVSAADREALLGMMQGLWSKYSVDLVRDDQIAAFGRQVEAQAH
jgi:hypothetical protein